MKRASLLFALSCLVTGFSGAVQNQTYPLSPVTQIRTDTYQDGFNTIADSTWTIDVSTWVVFGSSYNYVVPSQTVYLTQYDWVSSTNPSSAHWNVTPSSWTLQHYTQSVIDQTQDEMINEIIDQDVEEYMVWPDTTNLPAHGTWMGWCLGFVNGKYIPVACP